MKVSTISILLFIISNCPSVQAQTIDTLIDVGGYKLHFNIIKGKGIPILFDAGGGEDATTWKKIIQPIAERTATTLITYHRAGFGKSTFDTTRHGILNGMIGLIDATTTCFYDEKRLAATQQMINHQNTDKLKASNPGVYYQGADFSNNIEQMRKFAFPTAIPVTDFVSDHPPSRIARTSMTGNAVIGNSPQPHPTGPASWHPVADILYSMTTLPW